ncbi:MAG: putative membrane protein [Bacteroidia bacterium]|jgi:putative membrane protein
MEILAKILIALVALEHLYILYLEMFAWETLGKKTFKGSMPDEMFAKTKNMAANQGLYNGFLAAGLIWSLLIHELSWSNYVAMFFLACVVIAGIYGAISVSRRIFFVQGIPALIAWAVVVFVEYF